MVSLWPYLYYNKSTLCLTSFQFLYLLSFLKWQSCWAVVILRICRIGFQSRHGVINDKYESLTSFCKSAPTTLGFENQRYIHVLSKIGIDINLKVCRSLRLNPYVCQITTKPWFSKFRLAKRLENDILLSHFKSS